MFGGTYSALEADGGTDVFIHSLTILVVQLFGLALIGNLMLMFAILAIPPYFPTIPHLPRMLSNGGISGPY